MEAHRRLHAGLIACALGVMAACASTPETATAPAPEKARFRSSIPVTIDTPLTRLPGWPGDNGDAGLYALRESCRYWVGRDPDEMISDAAPYAGRIGDWADVCNGLSAVPDYESAIALLAQTLLPLEVVPDDRNRFTGYFEPEIDVRARPEGRFTEPVPAVPADLVRDGPRRTLQRLPDGSTRPYPPRAWIDTAALPAIAYARPEDVFFLQIQGSGRLSFPDGRVIRAAFAAHNAQEFRGIANWLFSRGEITRGEMGMKGIKAWMASARPEELREAMNANPRYVFFEAQTIEDPAQGPNGAMGVPLTAWGSLAVDTRLHALGLPVWIETAFPEADGAANDPLPFRALMVAQDTGGAIQGPVRGDIYFGTGEAAGAQASRVNTPGRIWVLLPQELALAIIAEAPGS